MDLETLERQASNCILCELHKGRNKPVFSRGYPNADIVICGMCPGPDENKAGVPFVGAAGKILDDVMYEAFGTSIMAEYPLDGLEGSDINDFVYVTNLVKCFVQPGKVLEKQWMNTCLPYFVVQLNLIQPKAIIALGKDVCNFLLNNDYSMGYMRGKIYDYMGHIKLISTYHPSYLARGGGKNHKYFKIVIEDFSKALNLKGEDHARL